MCLYRGYVGIHSSGFRDFLLKPELLRAIVDSGFEHPSEGKISNSMLSICWVFIIVCHYMFNVLCQNIILRSLLEVRIAFIIIILNCCGL